MILALGKPVEVVDDGWRAREWPGYIGSDTGAYLHDPQVGSRHKKMNE
jgi:hypothetical protein